MLLIPAIDLKDGRCVRLQQGNMDAATTFSEDPAAMARPQITPSMPSASTAHRRSMSCSELRTPEAINGMVRARASVTVASMLMPVSMPSRPMSV